MSGWKLNADYDHSIRKFVLIGAPHTSNWDGFYGILAVKILELPITILAKKALFKWPLGGLMRALGAIPVDRENPLDYVGLLVPRIKASKEFVLGMAPEGTRGKVDRWKTGFYRIAVQANIPIFLGYLDYKKKELGICRIFYPSGNKEADMEEIKKCYRDVTPKHPEKWDLEGITNS